MTLNDFPGGNTEGKSRVSIIIPVYNEKATVREVLWWVAEAPMNGLGREIIIVDDFSKDGKREILKEEFAGREGIKVLYHDRNRCKGAALRTGIAQSTGNIVLIQDADLEHGPHEYPKLLTPILSGKADVVYGSRFAGGGR